MNDSDGAEIVHVSEGDIVLTSLDVSKEFFVLDEHCNALKMDKL